MCESFLFQTGSAEGLEYRLLSVKKKYMEINYIESRKFCKV